MVLFSSTEGPLEVCDVLFSSNVKPSKGQCKVCGKVSFNQN